jgi:hypothetical protein
MVKRAVLMMMRDVNLMMRLGWLGKKIQEME